MAWDAAGRPGSGRLRFDAYPSGMVPSGAVPAAAGPPGTNGLVHVTPHATFVISWP